MSGRFPFLNSDQDLFDIVDEYRAAGSYFGNYDIDIYDEDIEALKEGKTLIYVEEYGFRIHYKEGKKPLKNMGEPHDYISEEMGALKKEIENYYKDRSYAWEDCPE